jgi:hypothetical protein
MGERREGQVAVETECMHVVGRMDESGLATSGSKYAQGTIALQQMAAPQPRSSGDVNDTSFLKGKHISTEGKSSDLKNLKGSMLGHFDMSPIPPMAERQAVAKGLEGVFLNWLIGSIFGAAISGWHSLNISRAWALKRGTTRLKRVTLFFREKSKVFSKAYLAKAGDILWTGVGCVHSFQNRSEKPLRWRERSRLSNLRKMDFDLWRSGRSMQWRLKVS